VYFLLLVDSHARTLPASFFSLIPRLFSEIQHGCTIQLGPLAVTAFLRNELLFPSTLDFRRFLPSVHRKAPFFFWCLALRGAVVEVAFFLFLIRRFDGTRALSSFQYGAFP